jgi:hypothetical protein
LALVRAAFFAAADRWAAVRVRADARACRDRAAGDAAERPSRASALVAARERLADGLRFLAPAERAASVSRAACWRVRSGAAPGLGEADGNRLLGRPRAVLALANVVHLLPHKLPRLRRRRFPLAPVALGTLDRITFWHDHSWET